MRRIRIVGLCLVAVFALTAMVTSAASAALPEYGVFNVKTKVVEPLTAEQKISFKNKSLTEAKLEGGVVIECSSDVGKGVLFGPKKTVKLKVTYSGCKAPAISSSCQKAPTKPGVILTELLKGELGYASEKSGGALHVINRLVPESSLKPFAKFTCGPKKELTVIVTGVILTEPGPVGPPAATSGFTVNKEKAAEEGFGCSKQAFLFENGTGTCKHLETGAGVSWNVSDDEVTYGTKKIELKA
jgi:hypothetical protein